MSYDELRRAIEHAPTTWVPGLLRAIVERDVNDEIFAKPRGIHAFIDNVLRTLGKQ